LRFIFRGANRKKPARPRIGPIIVWNSGTSCEGRFGGFRSLGRGAIFRQGSPESVWQEGFSGPDFPRCEKACHVCPGTFFVRVGICNPGRKTFLFFSPGNLYSRLETRGMARGNTAGRQFVGGLDKSRASERLLKGRGGGGWEKGTVSHAGPLAIKDLLAAGTPILFFRYFLGFRNCVLGALRCPGHRGLNASFLRGIMPSP